MRIPGLFSAVATPLNADGRLDLRTFDRMIDFHLAAGVDGVCVGGATGEYPHVDIQERKEIIRRAAGRLANDRALLVGIGAPSIRRVIELGEAAIEAGSRALLLPMPAFFRYEQDDLRAFAADVSRKLRAPCLLYNLPDFTNGLSAATMLELMRGEEFIVGVKDSSGCQENLEALGSASARDAWTLLVGDDRLLLRGLQAGWDGSISGVAGFCPELLVALCQSFRRADHDEASRLQGLVNELGQRLSAFPTPWGIRIGLEARGFQTGPLPLPLTARRQEQAREFKAWLPEWLDRSLKLPSFLVRLD